MNAGNIIRRTVKPIGVFVLLGALTLTLAGCDRHSGSIHYYNDGGYYGDVRVYNAPPVIVRHRPYHTPPPVFGRGPGRGRPHRGHR